MVVTHEFPLESYRNAIAEGITGEVAMSTKKLDLDGLLAQASEEAGLDDLGDPRWRDGAERLVDALDGEAALHEIGAMVASGEIVSYLRDRMRIVDWAKRNPAISQRDVTPPVVILGQPRTGTTILFDVLAQDPANRVPLTWEVDRPWPPPETATYDTDPRIADVQATLEGVELLIPGFMSMHDMGALLPQECVRITAGDFRSMIFSTQYRIPSYQRWLLREADMSSAYHYHRMFLQHLQSAHPAERWVLKSPAHLWSPKAMIAEYPGALVVQTHRDPVRVLCSLASLIDLLRKLASDQVSITEIAHEWLEDVALGLDRAVESRKDGTIASEQAVDVYFRDFLSDPMSVVRTIYDRMDTDLTPEAERKMKAFLAENPQEKHGGHRYTFSETGLDAGELRERMRPYQEFFDVPDEPLP
jgi:Sulfotransferase family